METPSRVYKVFIKVQAESEEDAKVMGEMIITQAFETNQDFLDILEVEELSQLKGLTEIPSETV